MKKGDLVYVEWMDATGSSGWHNPVDNPEWYDDTPAVIFETGFFLKQTKHYIILCSKFVKDNSLKLSQQGDMSKIPLGCIVKKEVLKRR